MPGADEVCPTTAASLQGKLDSRLTSVGINTGPMRIACHFGACVRAAGYSPLRIASLGGVLHVGDCFQS